MKKTTLIAILSSIDDFIEFNHIKYGTDVIVLRHSIILQYVHENGLTDDDYYDLCDELD
jgi:hypothetical protein